MRVPKVNDLFRYTDNHLDLIMKVTKDIIEDAAISPTTERNSVIIEAIRSGDAFKVGDMLLWTKECFESNAYRSKLFEYPEKEEVI